MSSDPEHIRVCECVTHCVCGSESLNDGRRAWLSAHAPLALAGSACSLSFAAESECEGRHRRLERGNLLLHGLLLLGSASLEGSEAATLV